MIKFFASVTFSFLMFVAADVHALDSLINFQYEYSVNGKTTKITNLTHNYFLRLDGPTEIELYALDKKLGTLSRANRIANFSRFKNDVRADFLSGEVGDYFYSYGAHGYIGYKDYLANSISVGGAECPDIGLNKTITLVTVSNLVIEGTTLDIMSFHNPKPTIPAIKSLKLNFKTYCNSLSSSPIATGSLILGNVCTDASCLANDQIADLNSMIHFWEIWYGLLKDEKLLLEKNYSDIELYARQVDFELSSLKAEIESLKNLISQRFLSIKSLASSAIYAISNFQRECRTTRCLRNSNLAKTYLRRIQEQAVLKFHHSL